MNTLFVRSETDENVVVKFYSSVREIEMAVRKTITLRDVQKKLCKAFQQRFPLMTATLICAGERFDDFNDYPFVEANDGEEIQINFVQTSDMCANAICLRRYIYAWLCLYGNKWRTGPCTSSILLSDVAQHRVLTQS